jgi:hypothetical protein
MHHKSKAGRCTAEQLQVQQQQQQQHCKTPTTTKRVAHKVNFRMHDSRHAAAKRSSV